MEEEVKTLKLESEKQKNHIEKYKGKVGLICLISGARLEVDLVAVRKAESKCASQEGS